MAWGLIVGVIDLPGFTSPEPDDTVRRIRF